MPELHGGEVRKVIDLLQEISPMPVKGRNHATDIEMDSLENDSELVMHDNDHISMDTQRTANCQLPKG